MQVYLGFTLTTEDAINSNLVTFLAWAIPSKGSYDDSFILYEGGVL